MKNNIELVVITACDLYIITLMIAANLNKIIPKLFSGIYI